MDASEVLREEAKSLALRAQNRTAELKAELEKIEVQKREIEAKREQTRLAAQRLLNYQPRIGIEYQCPGCWIDRGERKTLDSSIPSPRGHTILRCDKCRDWIIPSGN